jgi:hypothetical protein
MPEWVSFIAIGNLRAFDEVPGPRAENAHDVGVLIWVLLQMQLATIW